MKKFYVLLCVVMCLMGCSTPKQMTLSFGNEESSAAPLADAYIIDQGDELSITFFTIVGEGAAPYNSAGTEYQVRNDGTITLPIFGRLKVAGMTTLELADHLEQLVANQIKQPIVRVEIDNATVSVLGEVESPMAIKVPQPIRLTEVLSMVGGPTKYARLDNVLVQRQEGGTLQSFRINLMEDDLSQSPCYYLRKGDLLYIAPRIAK